MLSVSIARKISLRNTFWFQLKIINQQNQILRFILHRALALALDIQLGGSRMEVVSSKDGTPFLDLNVTRNRAELACSISSLPIGTQNEFNITHSIFEKENCANIGNSERRVADTLDRTRSRILTERSSEKANKIAGANKRSILFFVTSSISAEKDRIKSVLLKMLQEMPGNEEWFNPAGFGARCET